MAETEIREPAVETVESSLEQRIAALEELTAKLLDYGAQLQLEETQARITALEAKAAAAAAMRRQQSCC